MKGKVDICRYLVEELKFDIDSVVSRDSGETPLFFAVLDGQVAAVRYLLEKGADPNKQDRGGLTPLHEAAKEGSDEIALLLLSKGAYVNLSSSEGTPLHAAASYGKSSIIKILLERHADPNNVAANLFTPLAAALYATPERLNESTCLKCIKLLVKAGADLNSRNPETPLVIATNKGLTECVEYLLKGGADANIPDNHDGSRPIEIAARSGGRKLVQILFPFTTPIQAVSNWNIEGTVAYAKSGNSKDSKTRLKLQGAKAVEGKDYIGAIKFYSEAINLDRRDAILYSNRGFCHLKMGEAQDALRDANDCIKLRPDWTKGYYRKGAALMSLKDYRQACGAFMAGFKVDPTNGEMLQAFWRDKVGGDLGLASGVMDFGTWIEKIQVKLCATYWLLLLEAADAMKKEHSAEKSVNAFD